MSLSASTPCIPRPTPRPRSSLAAGTAFYRVRPTSPPCTRRANTCPGARSPLTLSCRKATGAESDEPSRSGCTGRGSPSPAQPRSPRFRRTVTRGGIDHRRGRLRDHLSRPPHPPHHQSWLPGTQGHWGTRIPHPRARARHLRRVLILIFAPASTTRSWRPFATPRSACCASPARPTSPKPNATTPNNPTDPSTCC